MSNISVADILSFLNECGILCEFHGNPNIMVSGFSSLANYKHGTFTWIKNQGSITDQIETTRIRLAITSKEVEGSFKNIIRTDESKRAFFSCIEHFYESKKKNRKPIGEHTYIGPDVKIGKEVSIGHNCSIDGEIIIGDSVIIWNNVTIINKVSIGENTEIQSGSIIGHDGFGYVEDENHVKTMVKHYGGVRIGRNVLISSNVCVVRGTIDDTVIENGVKIDNMSHIAHNCYLGQNSALAFPCFLGGSSKIMDNGYVAGGIIRNQCIVHANAFVGMGAVVTKDVQADTIVIGNPAKEYKKYVGSK